MSPLLAESIYWHFPILLVTVSLVYSATRYEKWPEILHEAVTWGFRMAIFLIGIGVALFLIPRVPWWLSVGVGIIVTMYMVYSAFHTTGRPEARRSSEQP